MRRRAAAAATAAAHQPYAQTATRGAASAEFEDEDEDEDDDEDAGAGATGPRLNQSSVGRLPDEAEQRASLPSEMADEDCKGLKSGRPLPSSTTKMLREWLLAPQMFNFPWPDEPVKQEMARRARITVSRLNVWLTNGRKRLWAPLRRQMGLPVLNYSEAKKRR